MHLKGDAGKESNTRHRLGIYVCDCGREFIVRKASVTSGNTKSCGCLVRNWAKTGNARRVHGLAKSPEYYIWISMKQRCHNPNKENYEDYGGRGIEVCEEWRNSFEAFIASVGFRPSPHHLLDRIDNDGNYEPGNVRWATGSESNKNRRSFTRSI